MTDLPTHQDGVIDRLNRAIAEHTPRVKYLQDSHVREAERIRRVKPDQVIVNGKEERHAEGAYYLEWREGAKRVRLSVGKDPADASARRLRKEAELNPINNGIAVTPENGTNGHRSLAALISEFLDETKLTKKPKTLAAYTTALNYFTQSCPKLCVHEI